MELFHKLAAAHDFFIGVMANLEIGRAHFRILASIVCNKLQSQCFHLELDSLVMSEIIPVTSASLIMERVAEFCSVWMRTNPTRYD